MFCKVCGQAQRNPQDVFCWNCGNRYFEENGIAASQGEIAQVDYTPKEIEGYSWIDPEKYTGQEREFTFLGKPFHVPADVDAFIHWRKVYRNNAFIQHAYFKRDYYANVHNLYQYLDIAPQVYLRFLEPLVSDAYKILMSNGLYEITLEEFRQTHLNDFCTFDDTYKVMTDSVELTLQANERSIINSYNNIPNIGFIGGLFTVAAVEAANYAIRNSYENRLNNLNITPPQEFELFNRIRHDNVCFQAFGDYWDVYKSLAYRLHEAGLGVWFPTQEKNKKAEALFSNLSKQAIPEADVESVIIQIIEARPDFAAIYGWIKQNRNHNPEENEEVFNYFGF